MRGRRIALSTPRRLLADLSHLARGFPRATLLTRINVAALVEPRDQARIPWPVVFAKAYALVAAGSPPLRRVYVKLPWPHLYELPQSVASIIVERDWPHDGDSGEKALFLGRLKAPDAATLPNLATRMLALKSAPIDSIADFRRALAIARLPRPLRLLLVWLSLNIGRQVPNFMGSFAISALGSHGAAIVDTILVWSSFLNYGPIAPDGGVDIYLSVDHRVIDGGPAARAIRVLEAMLNGPVLDELRALAGMSWVWTRRAHTTHRSGAASPAQRRDVPTRRCDRCPGVARFRTRCGLRFCPRAAVSALASGRRGPTLSHTWATSAGRTLGAATGPSSRGDCLWARRGRHSLPCGRFVGATHHDTSTWAGSSASQPAPAPFSAIRRPPSLAATASAMPCPCQAAQAASLPLPPGILRHLPLTSRSASSAPDQQAPEDQPWQPRLGTGAAHFRKPSLFAHPHCEPFAHQHRPSTHLSIALAL